jgi:type II secretory pathway component PulL
MNEFEDRLRQALQRREPPSGFAERVVARVPPRHAPVWTRWRSVAAIAAVLLVMFSALLYEHHRAQRAEAANRQLMFALRLAAEKIDRVQHRVQNSSPVMTVDRDEVKGSL